MGLSGGTGITRHPLLGIVGLACSIVSTSSLVHGQVIVRHPDILQRGWRGSRAPLLANAQSQPLVGAQFDVVSIKPSVSAPGGGGGMRTLPDGTFTMTNQPIRSIINAGSLVPVRDVSGLPDWTQTERYDIVAKPAPGSNPTREQRNEMLLNLLIERMKLVANVEEQERTTLALIVARDDGRLGPQLTPSTLDCSAAQAPPSPGGATAPRRCGSRMGPGIVEMNGVVLDQLARSISRLAGGLVDNRTGLDGRYDLTLRFAPPRLSTNPTATTDDAPQLETALQEQLGLKLRPEKTVPILVIDHIERPTSN
jgi:uncharacterized protein (TIGR03435 family)